MKRLEPHTVVIVAVLALVALCSGMLDYFTPCMGDDLMFRTQLGGDDYRMPNRRTLSFILAHICGCNGRILDYLGPVIINLLPRFAAAVVMGVMAAVFYASVLYASGLPRRHYMALTLVLMAVTLAVMPWWDSMWLRVCQFNYQWSTAFGLLAVTAFFRGTEGRAGWLRLAGLFALAFLAGGSHEQVGLSLIGAFTVFVIFQFRRLQLDRRRYTLLAGLLAGALMPVAAPAFWLRLGGGTQRQEMWTLLWTTLPVVMLMLLTITALLCSYRGRKFLSGLTDGIWLVLVLSAVFSSLIAIFSGIPGRTGMFAEACALTALARMLIHSRRHCGRQLAVLAGVGSVAFIAVHFIVSVHWQSKLYDQYRTVTDRYRHSADGIVFADITNRYDVSPLTLLRVKGVPDADDVWLLHALEIANRNDNLQLVIIPAELENRIDGLTEPATSGSSTVYPRSPDGVAKVDDGRLAVMQQHGCIYIVQHAITRGGKPIWVVTERVRDPGDLEIK